ncbi:hypothetical protein ACO0LC_24860 [Undibacterium sp. JH2W]|uniref:hypothetical protein n=1 Tax=Undibacterium sp. JH2W TaxID=3413037 RepID=UPI003BF15555
MLYTADVVIEQSVNSSLMEMPDEERLTSTDGLDENHDYGQICDVSIDEAIETIANEAELLTRIESIPEEEQEEALAEISDELFDDFDSLIGLDFGVAGLVEALTAIGCATISSCNGGVMGGSHAMPHPWIIFHAPTNLVDLLLWAAKEANAGLINNYSGMLQAYSDDIWKFNRMASHLIKRHKEFISG